MSTLNKSPEYFRATKATGTSPQVDRETGSGVIRGVSVVTRGEALGHDLWLDADFVSDVTAAINSGNGIKARFTHPGLSSDGLGTMLGRIKNAKTVGARTIADLHFIDSAHNAPDGDLAEYVMSLADDDPESFGLSIVFQRDILAEDDFERENMQGDIGRERFVSPDEDNKQNYRHARLAQLRAADAVDSPAANPDGLFRRGQDIAADAEALLSYSFGLSDERPKLVSLSISPDRVSAAVTRFLSRHNLEVIERKPAMADNTTAAPAEVEQPTREQFSAELKRYTQAFGAENGTSWFAENVSFEDAQSKHIESQDRRIAGLTAKIEELQETLNSLDTGEQNPAESSDGIDHKPGQRKLAHRIRIAGKSYSHN